MQTEDLFLLAAVGRIAKSNPDYLKFLESQLKKPIEDLTVLQLLAINSEVSRKYKELVSCN